MFTGAGLREASGGGAPGIAKTGFAVASPGKLEALQVKKRPSSPVRQVMYNLAFENLVWTLRVYGQTSYVQSSLVRQKERHRTKLYEGPKFMRRAGRRGASRVYIMKIRKKLKNKKVVNEKSRV